MVWSELHGVMRGQSEQIEALRHEVGRLTHELDVCDLEQKQYGSLTAVHRATALELKLAQQVGGWVKEEAPPLPPAASRSFMTCATADCLIDGG